LRGGRSDPGEVGIFASLKRLAGVFSFQMQIFKCPNGLPIFRRLLGEGQNAELNPNQPQIPHASQIGGEKLSEKCEKSGCFDDLALALTAEARRFKTPSRKERQSLGEASEPLRTAAP
jgi:hypothetical protein